MSLTLFLKKNSKEVSEGTSKSTYLDRINWVNSLYWKQTSHDDVDVELVNCPNAPGRLKIQKNLVFQQKNNLPAAYNNNKQTQVDNKRLYLHQFVSLRGKVRRQRRQTQLIYLFLLPSRILNDSIKKHRYFIL